MDYSQWPTSQQKKTYLVIISQKKKHHILSPASKGFWTQEFGNNSLFPVVRFFSFKINFLWGRSNKNWSSWVIWGPIRNPKLDFGIFSHVGFIAFCPRSRWYKVDHWDRISPCKPRQTKKHKIPTVAKKISKNQKISEAFLRTRSCFSLGFILIQLKNLSDGRSPS